MNLRNYTTEVPASKSINNIEELLVNFGARNIMKEYSPTGKVEAISFIMEIDNMKLPFRIPGKVKNGYMWLRKKYPRASDKILLERAERMVWKQQYDWVHMQFSQIELDQMEKMEAFFPFLYDVQKRVTYYDNVKAGGFKALLPSTQ